MDGEKKNNVKVLSTNDIRKHAHNWNLAGDVGLLAHLENFSENLCKKTQETQKNFESLVENYEEVFAKIGNVTNEFLALQNSQFVENRVYDEETPTEEKQEIKPKPDAAEQERILLAQYKEAVETGVKLLDTHFQEVQLPPNSDSEEDDEVSTGNSLIWKAKNPYAGKKFPLLIGSSEWWSDDHVGLGDYEDNLDTDKILSDSESDMESTQGVQKDIQSSSSSSVDNEKIIPKKPKFLESSTEDIFGWDGNDNFASEEYTAKDRKSIIDEPQDFYPPTEEKREEKSGNEDRIEGDTVNENNDDIENKPSKINNAFTRELAAKLASVTQKGDNSKIQNQEEKSPLKKQEEKKIYNSENLFDETDDSSDLFSHEIKNVTKSNKTIFFDAETDDNLFSGSNNLFSGSGNIFGKSENQSVSKTNQDERINNKNNKKIEPSPAKKPLVNNLFEDVDEESNLFSSSPTQTKQKIESSPAENQKSSKTETSIRNKKEEIKSGGLFDNLEDDFEDDFMGKSKLFDTKKKKESSPVIKSAETKSTAENISYEDKDEIFEKSNTTKQSDFPLAKDSTNKKLSILDDDDDDDLFSSSFKEEKKSSSSAKAALPLLDDDDTSLFVDKPKLQDSLSISSSRSSLFDETISSKTRLASVFEKDKNYKMEDDIFNTSNDPLFGEDGSKSDLFSGKSSNKPADKKKSLFDDFDDNDDLFGSTKDSGKKEFKVEANKQEKKVVEIDDLFGGEENTKQVKSTKNTFLEEPGDDDLFGITSVEKKPESVPKKENYAVANNDIFSVPLAKTTSEGSFFSATGEEPLFKGEGKASTDQIKPKPPTSLSLNKNDNISKPKSVGKLNIPDNLKSKFESMAKNISSGETKPKEVSSVVDFDEPVEQSTNVLKCPSKDRVKIQVRRRPQSRRARQEAIRKSSIDYAVEEDKPVPEKQSVPSKIPENPLFSSPVASNPLSPSTDEEDYFNVPELDTNFEKEDQSIFSAFNNSSSSKVDDNLLFDGAPVLSPVSPKHETKKAEVKSLFPSSSLEEEEEDNQSSSLFTASSKGTEKEKPDVPKKSEVRSLFPSSQEEPNNSLFDSSEITKPDISKKAEVNSLFLSSQDEDNQSSLFVASPKETEKEIPKKAAVKSLFPISSSQDEENTSSLFGSTKKEKLDVTKKEEVKSLFSSSQDEPNTKIEKSEIPKNSEAKSLFPSSSPDEEDNHSSSLFTPSTKIIEKEKTEILKKAEVKSLFPSSSPDEEDNRSSSLFTSSKITKKVETPEVKSFLPPPSSQDDDNHSSSLEVTKKEKTDSLFEPQSEEVEDLHSDSLFDSSKPKFKIKNESNLFKSSDPDEDHLFTPKVTENTIFKSAEPKKNEPKHEDSDSDSLFGSPKSKESNSVFDSSESVRKSSQTKPKQKISIFGDDDGSEDDDNLFKPSKDRKKESSLFESVKNKDAKKKSLFDADIDDEDDLFGGKLAVSSKMSRKEKVAENVEKREEKNKENSNFVDPLGLMSNED